MEPQPPAARDAGFSAVVLFCISFLGLSAELLIALLLGLKTWSHIVYVVIAFALLGYGVGSTLYLVFQRQFDAWHPRNLAALFLAFIALSTYSMALALPGLPLELSMVADVQGFLSLTIAYVTISAPFAGIGLAISSIFSRRSSESGKLYFWDLLGAGLGAAAYFPMTRALGPYPALLVLSLASMILAAVSARWARTPRSGPAAVALGGLALLMAIGLRIPEPEYRVDPVVGWECIPNSFKPEDYRVMARSWHHMGRTDLHEFHNPGARAWVSSQNAGTFEIPLDPPPAFSYFTNSHRAGTPVFNLSPEGLAGSKSQLRLFSVPMEFPYLLLERPRVLVIGAGGGRDLFMARAHGAREILGAEINPGTFEAMSPSGAAYDYSGRIYDAPGVRVHNIDGRHLVRTRPEGSTDLVILNGVDTYAALSTGAFAYAESYLYTQEAVRDYLRALSPDGFVNFNRWIYRFRPRESLRLFVMVLDALKSVGAADPGRHVLLGKNVGWGMFLVKRTPFTPEEVKRVEDYFREMDVDWVLSPFRERPLPLQNEFERYAGALREGRGDAFVDGYWADISVVSDDSPFFYKYYRIAASSFGDWIHPGGGEIALRVQGIIVLQTVFFTILFIGVPLLIFKARGLSLLPSGGKFPFLAYFASLGLGFIFVEMAFMQQFVLLLGSPLYSVSIILVGLLLSTGVGSLLGGRLSARVGGELRLVGGASGAVILYLLAASFGGKELLNQAVQLPLEFRITLSILLVAPAGLALGVFFPTGIRVLGGHRTSTVAWAWGINSAFTVLGSSVSILLAQGLGFRAVLLIAAALYAVAALAFVALRRAIGGAPATGPEAEAPVPASPEKMLVWTAALLGTLVLLAHGAKVLSTGPPTDRLQSLQKGWLEDEARSSFEYYERALADPSKRAWAHGKTAEMYGVRGRWPDAVRECTLAIEAYRDHPEALSLRARAHFEEKRWREAVADFDTALALDPSDLHAAIARGVARSRLGESQAARADFRKVLEATSASWKHRERVEDLLRSLPKAP